MDNLNKEDLIKFAENYLKKDLAGIKRVFYRPSEDHVALHLDFSEDKYDDHIVSFYLDDGVMSFEDDSKGVVRDITPQWLRFIQGQDFNNEEKEL